MEEKRGRERKERGNEMRNRRDEKLEKGRGKRTARTKKGIRFGIRIRKKQEIKGKRYKLS